MEDFQKQELLKSQIALFKQRGLDSFLNKDLANFQSRFDRLNELLYKPASNENFDDAYQNFYKIFDAVPLLYNQLGGLNIFRAQTNKPNELFSTQTRISYNKTNPKCISPGKFNVWYEPMFYGCLPYKTENEKDYFPPALGAALETCKDLSDKRKEVLMQDFTVGRWSTKTPFSTVNLCFDEVHLSYNYELKHANETYIRILKDNLSSSAGDFVTQVFQFYSNLCSTGSNEGSYYILTALFNAIKIYYSQELKMEINGLISSSAATEGRALNIVMTPSAVDKYLMLNAVTMYRYILIMPERNGYATYPFSEIITNHQQTEDFNYSFKNYIIPAERFVNNMNLRS